MKKLMMAALSAITIGTAYAEPHLYGDSPNSDKATYDGEMAAIGMVTGWGKDSKWRVRIYKYADKANLVEECTTEHDGRMLTSPYYKILTQCEIPRYETFLREQDWGYLEAYVMTPITVRKSNGTETVEYINELVGKVYRTGQYSFRIINCYDAEKRGVDRIEVEAGENVTRLLVTVSDPNGVYRVETSDNLTDWYVAEGLSASAKGFFRVTKIGSKE